MQIRRLTPADAPEIVDCFKRVYGDSYANEQFYDAQLLAARLGEQTLCSVGAFDDTRLLGHMAMTIVAPGAASAELGNTVVDPDARGGGVAWRVGDELIEWCRSKGYEGFLHYPTTDHHIMQQQSVKAGFETGLMLGYIPAETDGKVGEHSGGRRQAATVVYQPLAPAAPQSLYCPAQFRQLLDELAAPTGLERTWLSSAPWQGATNWSTVEFERRGLRRITVHRSGREFYEQLPELLQESLHWPCLQMDLLMDNPDIETAADAAIAAGFKFCAWLPGYQETDVLRLQRTDPKHTQIAPGVVNPVAQQLLQLMNA